MQQQDPKRLLAIGQLKLHFPPQEHTNARNLLLVGKSKAWFARVEELSVCLSVKNICSITQLRHTEENVVLVFPNPPSLPHPPGPDSHNPNWTQRQ